MTKIYHVEWMQIKSDCTNRRKWEHAFMWLLWQLRQQKSQFENTRQLQCQLFSWLLTPKWQAALYVPALLTDIYRTGKPLLPGDRIQRCGVYRLEYRWASTPPWWSTYHGSNWAGEQLPDYNVNAINCYASHFLIKVQPEKVKSNTCWWDGDEVVCEVGSDGEGCWHGDRFSVSPIWTKSTRKIWSSPPAGQGAVKER